MSKGDKNMGKRNYYKLAEEFNETFVFGNRKGPTLYMGELNDFLKESVKRGADHKEQLLYMLDAGIMIGYKFAKVENRRNRNKENKP